MHGFHSPFIGVTIMTIIRMIRTILTIMMMIRCGSVVAMMLFLILLFTAFKANDNLRVIQLNEEVSLMLNRQGDLKRGGMFKV